MHIYYEHNFFRSNSKEELIGFTEFLSNTGGLLGLFMGFSVVSLIEIIYFLTFRPYCNRKKNSKNTHAFNSARGAARAHIGRKVQPVRKEVDFRCNRFFGRIKNRELALFRPEIHEETIGINPTFNYRYRYFE